MALPSLHGDETYLIFDETPICWGDTIIALLSPQHHARPTYFLAVAIPTTIS